MAQGTPPPQASGLAHSLALPQGIADRLRSAKFVSLRVIEAVGAYEVRVFSEEYVKSALESRELAEKEIHEAKVAEDALTQMRTALNTEKPQDTVKIGEVREKLSKLRSRMRELSESADRTIFYNVIASHSDYLELTPATDHETVFIPFNRIARVTILKAAKAQNFSSSK